MCVACRLVRALYLCVLMNVLAEQETEVSWDPRLETYIGSIAPQAVKDCPLTVFIYSHKFTINTLEVFTLFLSGTF